jgi:hypothetical protein
MIHILLHEHTHYVRIYAYYHTYTNTNMFMCVYVHIRCAKSINTHVHATENVSTTYLQMLQKQTNVCIQMHKQACIDIRRKLLTLRMSSSQRVCCMCALHKEAQISVRSL